MSNIKSKITSLKVTYGFIQHYFFYQKNSAGFTLMELMVVLTVSAFLFTAVIVNINSQRAPRDIKIAQNEMVSNIRKIQSYSLSSRNLASGQSAEYFLIKFDLTKPNQYTIQAIFNVSSSPKLQDIETIKLPTNVKISSISISQRLQAPSIQNPASCALAAFASPFGKVIFNDGCNPAGVMSSPYTIQSTDDYQQLVNFQTNVQCSNNLTPPPASCAASTDSIFTITLVNSANSSLQKRVIINGITGSVSFD